MQTVLCKKKKKKNRPCSPNDFCYQSRSAVKSNHRLSVKISFKKENYHLRDPIIFNKETFPLEIMLLHYFFNICKPSLRNKTNDFGSHLFTCIQLQGQYLFHYLNKQYCRLRLFFIYNIRKKKNY